VLFPYVVERSKRCIDFALTIYFWHIVLSAFVNGFPTAAVWWGMLGAAFAVTLTVSMVVCRYAETRDVVLV